MKFAILVFILLLILVIISFPTLICLLEIILRIFWVEKFSKLVNSHFIIEFFFFCLQNILLLEVQSMKMNNNATYCASVINYGAYEKKKGILSLFHMSQEWNEDQSMRVMGEQISIHEKKELSSSQNTENRVEYFPSRLF